ncbi:MAG: hypothetical protein KGK16_09780, partial [Bradyrhizobium sp.]|nr:hypothetical protein [Bradyrhizobium sp.]
MTSIGKSNDPQRLFDEKSDSDGVIYDSRLPLTTRGIWQQRGAGSRRSRKLRKFRALIDAFNLHIEMKCEPPGP